MIPVTAAVVGGQDATAGGRRGPGSTRRAATLTGSYVVGLSLTYALLGLVAGLTGTLFGSISTNPWLFLLLANLLVGFALMLYDVLPVPVPQRLLQRAATLEGHGRMAGTFLVGAMTGVGMD